MVVFKENSMEKNFSIEMNNYSKPTILKNSKLQEEFDKKGFVKFKLLDNEQITRLEDFYYETQKEHEVIIDKKKFHATNETDNAHLIAQSDLKIKEIIYPSIQDHFFNFKPIAANYLIKQIGQESILGPHQDLLFVDEKKYYSGNVWIPTSATAKQNGCLRFIEGSHLWSETIRPLPSYPWKYETVKNELESLFVDVPTEIGECILLNHACIHASYPNLSDKIRIAAILALVPEDASIYHYYLPNADPSQKVEQYEMTLEDFVQLEGGKRPKNAKLINSFFYDFTPIQNKVLSSIQKKNPKKIDQNDTFRNKLQALFKRFR